MNSINNFYKIHNKQSEVLTADNISKSDLLKKIERVFKIEDNSKIGQVQHLLSILLTTFSKHCFEEIDKLALKYELSIEEKVEVTEWFMNVIGVYEEEENGPA